MTPHPRILIVDDDDDFAESLGSFLAFRGYLVARAADSDEGIRMALARRPDLIVMDVMMRERTEGFFAIHEIRRNPQLAGVPIFAVSAIYTAAADFAVPPGSDWLAQDEFFRKPVDFDQLLERIQARVADVLSEKASRIL